MNKALDGINLVEFSSNLGAAYAAMLLAEQGARAVIVEPPDGARERGTAHFHALNRSKRALFLDLQTERARVERLLRWADVAVLGWTGARMRELGLDYAALNGINPHLVVLHVPPLGNCGPLADFDASDELASALGGIYGSQWALSGNPVALHFPAASYSAGVLGATATVAALCARERGGDGQPGGKSQGRLQGQLVEVSLLAGAFSLQTGGIMRHEKMTRMYEGPLDPLGPIPCYRLFRAADGEYLFVACGNVTFWNKLALAIERPELVSDPRFEGAPWGVASQHRQALKDLLQEIIATRPREEWLRVLRENDIPCAPVLSRTDFINHPQVDALGMRRAIDDPTLGATIQPGIAVGLEVTPGEITGPAPAISYDRAGDLSNDRMVEGWLAEQPARSHDGAARGSLARGPLDGLLILDFCSYIAGSYGPMILGQMGADVIKIESLDGDAFRHFGFGFLGWNQGKRALSLDLAAPEGREIIHGLVRRADIVVENLRPGRMRRFGLDYQSLSAINPRLIYMSVNGFGNRGPEHNQPGFDPLLQARSGLMAAEGGHHQPPLYLTCAICDYGAAMLSAFGCVLALRARERLGRGQLCETSLLQSAMAFQAGEFIFFDGRPDMENGQPESRGRSALCRAYQCRDRAWLFVHAAEPAHWEGLRRVCKLAADPAFAAAAREPEDGPLAQAVAAAFAGVDRAQALAALNAAGVPALSTHRTADLFDDPQVNANELLAELHHSQWGGVVQTGTLAKFSATPGKAEHAAPLLGEHTDEILARHLGYDRERTADLHRRGIVK